MLINCVFGVLKSGLNTQCDVLPAWLVVYTFSTLAFPGFLVLGVLHVSNGDNGEFAFLYFFLLLLKFCIGVWLDMNKTYTLLLHCPKISKKQILQTLLNPKYLLVKKSWPHHSSRDIYSHVAPLSIMTQ